MTNNSKILWIIFLVITGCLIMAWVDVGLSPSYAIKSIIKLFLFLILPFGYSLLDRENSFRKLFFFEQKKFPFSVLLGVGVYMLIIGAYFLIGPYFDFSNITVTLQNNIGVNKNNFVFVSFYISVINSLLEEFFFRGFAFLTLKKLTSRKVAYLFSAGAFSIYHIAIMTSWFTPLLFVFLITSLFVAGLMLLNEKNDNIYTSWIVHISANLAINTIGFMLFGII